MSQSRTYDMDLCLYSSKCFNLYAEPYRNDKLIINYEN